MWVTHKIIWSVKFVCTKCSKKFVIQNQCTFHADEHDRLNKSSTISNASCVERWLWKFNDDAGIILKIRSQNFSKIQKQPRHVKASKFYRTLDNIGGAGNVHDDCFGLDLPQHSWTFPLTKHFILLFTEGLLRKPNKRKTKKAVRHNSFWRELQNQSIKCVGANTSQNVKLATVRYCQRLIFFACVRNSWPYLRLFEWTCWISQLKWWWCNRSGIVKSFRLLINGTRRTRRINVGPASGTSETRAMKLWRGRLQQWQGREGLRRCWVLKGAKAMNWNGTLLLLSFGRLSRNDGRIVWLGSCWMNVFLKYLRNMKRFFHEISLVFTTFLVPSYHNPSAVDVRNINFSLSVDGSLLEVGGERMSRREKRISSEQAEKPFFFLPPT